MKRSARRSPLSATSRAIFLAALVAACAHAPQRRSAPSGWDAYLAGDVVAAQAALAPADDLLSMLGRANLLHDSGRYAQARPLWMDVVRRAAADRSPWSRSVAAFAAHRIDVSAGEVPGSRALWAEELDRAVDLDVGPEARLILAGSAAVEWLRLGEVERARRLDGVRGCPDRVRVAGPVAGPVHRALRAPWTSAEPGNPVVVRSCQIPLFGATEQGGVYTVTLDLQSARASEWIVWIDSGAPFALRGYLHDSADRFLPRRVWLRVRAPAGRSQLAIRVAGAARDTVAVGLLDPGGGPAGAQPASSGAPSVPIEVIGATFPSTAPRAEGPHEAIAMLLSAHERYRHGDADGARRHLERLELVAPRFPVLWALAAAVDLVDPALTRSVARDRARSALQRAWSLDPSMARAAYNLVLIERDEEQTEDAARWVAAGRRAAPQSFRFDLIEAEMLLDRGWDREAQEALMRAERLHPQSCEVPRVALEAAQRSDDGAAERLRTEQMHRCDALSDAWAGWLRRRGRLPEARDEYLRLLGIRPDLSGWRVALFDVLVAMGDRAAARRELARLLDEDPRAAEARRRLADLALAEGDGVAARRFLQDGLRLDPGSRGLLRALTAIGGGDELDGFRVDAAEVVREFERDPWRPGREAPAVIVLDRTVLMIADDGSTRSLTHNVIRVLTKDGIERFGEVEVPARADVLAVRTRKAGGEVREAQYIPGKDSLSAPDLQVGDYVELEWVEAATRSARQGGFVADRFYFRSYDAPLYRTEYLVVAPAGMPLQVDRRASAPLARTERKDGHDVLAFAMGRMDQLVPEPSAAPFLDEVPSVRVASLATWESWREDLGETVFENGRIAAATARLARRLCRGEAGLSCVREIYRYATEIEMSGSPLAPAAASLSERSGSRLMVLRSMLRAAGLSPEVWMARPRSADVAEGAVPETEAFVVPLLRLRLGDRVLWLDPRMRRATPGHLPPALRGARAVSLESVAGDSWGLTGAGDGGERRSLDLRVDLGADGSAQVRGKERLLGWPAVAWREALALIPADRTNEEFEQRWLGFPFPGLALGQLDIGHRDDVDEPLLVSYAFRAPRVGRSHGAELRVALGFFPAMIAREYVGTSSRRSALQVDEQIETVLRAQVVIPPGFRVASLPDDVDLRGPLGRYRRRVRQDRNAIVVEREFHMPLQRVSPQGYAAFVRFASTVDAHDAEEAVLRKR